MKFNKIELSHSLEYGRHALAVDEHRYVRDGYWQSYALSDV